MLLEHKHPTVTPNILGWSRERRGGCSFDNAQLSSSPCLCQELLVCILIFLVRDRKGVSNTISIVLDYFLFFVLMSRTTCVYFIKFVLTIYLSEESFLPTLSVSKFFSYTHILSLPHSQSLV